jgi:hypothetical protein
MSPTSLMDQVLVWKDRFINISFKHVYKNLNATTNQQFKMGVSTNMGVLHLIEVLKGWLLNTP